MINDSVVDVIIYWRKLEKSGKKDASFLGKYYPVSYFNDVFDRDFGRSIVLDIYEHSAIANVSYAHAQFLMVNDNIPKDVRFKVYEGARCVAEVEALSLILTVKLDTIGEIISGDNAGWFIKVINTTKNADSYSILLSDNQSFDEVFNDYVATTKLLKRYFEKSQWRIKWFI